MEILNFFPFQFFCYISASDEELNEKYDEAKDL